MFTPKYFGFIQGHNYLDSIEIKNLKKLVYYENEQVTLKYEKEFSKLIGSGMSTSFASGRMGFFALMKVLGIGNNDEVILNGATCSVMVNAVLRINAVPVFSDIDPNTMGSSIKEIIKCITPHTKMVVAQHSFGVPCDIDQIAEMCSQKDIFLLEDSALAIGSTLNGQLVGSFGDAALFSTDHTKPLNTFSGGILYTTNQDLHKKIDTFRDKAGDLPLKKRKAIYKRILIESKYTKSDKYGLFQIIDTIKMRIAKYFGEVSPYLDKDSGSKIDHKDYPYPSRLPSFLAELGLIELRRWETVKSDRIDNLNRYITYFINNDISEKLPSAYFDTARKIVPLRLALAPPDGAFVTEKLINFIQVSWIWFKEPIISTNEPLHKLMYYQGDCPISEKIGENIINLPTSISASEVNYILSRMDKVII